MARQMGRKGNKSSLSPPWQIEKKLRLECWFNVNVKKVCIKALFLELFKLLVPMVFEPFWGIALKEGLATNGIDGSSSVGNGNNLSF